MAQSAATYVSVQYRGDMLGVAGGTGASTGGRVPTPPGGSQWTVLEGLALTMVVCVVLYGALMLYYWSAFDYEERSLVVATTAMLGLVAASLVGPELFPTLRLPLWLDIAITLVYLVVTGAIVYLLHRTLTKRRDAKTG